ncbi:MAG: TetR family transcriptional regulator [Rhodospirillales bacterium]|nr:TetR family transcriptional regulator [Alphaproteobacteria bacterium]MCB1839862.1 TetR family transcriptional regulator [Alphaproteobacteria bacterium]MCB9976472.1 TetR family transcriptional regulator [Rhodospirillales bacterium]
MAAKKRKKKTEGTDFRIKVVESALELAVEKGWADVTLRDVAERSGVSLPELYEHFEDRYDILCALGRMIDRKVLEGMSSGTHDETPMRERLFDLLMDRFEVLNNYREGIKAILKSFRAEPKLAVLQMPHLCRSMSWMLEAAGSDANGLTGAVKVAGLTGIYVKVLRVWCEDESPDLSKTMAALDQALGRAEAAVNTIKGRGRSAEKD